MKSLYKSAQGKKDILNLYDQKLNDLKITYTCREVVTSFGKTNIIITGELEKPPLLLFHGANGCAPIALETYPTLYKDFEVFAVDVLAQPNKSAATRLSMKDNSYGVWVHELIEKLELQDVTMAGFSFGGLIILKTLLHDEKNIKEVFLTAPAFIVNGNPLIALFKIFIPMKRYMKTKKTKFLEKFLNALFSERDEFAFAYLSKVFLYFDMDFTPVPIIKKSEARLLTIPITIIAAKKDSMFPGEKMIKRAHKIFPSIKNTVLLENSKHVQSKSDNTRIEMIILRETNHLH